MNELRNSARLALAMLAIAAAPSRAASLPPPGAASCSGCHATTGSATLPRLNGRDAGDIAAAMAAFRDGSRPATVMNRIARGFSDDEVRPIAAWLAAQQQEPR
jgi:sulfide dehydrogenase cytochrome subunit